jgi:peptidoglycan/xylan/chitin deacetylase (PgdA/CDA1 family)
LTRLPAGWAALPGVADRCAIGMDGGGESCRNAARRRQVSQAHDIDTRPAALGAGMAARPARAPSPLAWARLRGWSPTPLARASLYVHGLGAAALAAQPGAWPAVLGLLACNHAVLACGMHPRGSLLGPNLTRLPASAGRSVALTFDDGPDPEVTPRVLDLLEQHGARATFFVIGRRATRHASLLREMRRRGHDVANHTHRHPASFACRSPWGLWREVTDAQHAIADACGQAPRLFRAPMGLRSPLLDPVLAAEGLTLVSWTRRGYDTVARRPARVLDRLTSGLAAGDILLLHDTAEGRDAEGRPMVLAVLPALLERLAAAGLTAAASLEAAAMPAPDLRAA